MLQIVLSQISAKVNKSDNYEEKKEVKRKMKLSQQ